MIWSVHDIKIFKYLLRWKSFKFSLSINFYAENMTNNFYMNETSELI